MSRFIVISLGFIFTNLFFQSRDFPEKATTYTIYINFEDYSVRANVLYNSDKIKTKMFRTYYWYMNNDIKKTDGGYDGKLLHGEYKSFFRNMNLKEEGNFNYGLKDGIWKTWYLNGKIHEITNYKNGFEQGIQQVYDEHGFIISKTDFKKGIKSGKEILYRENKIDSVITYKKGQPEHIKIKKSHLQSKQKKEKDSVQNEKVKLDKPKDTIARTPKSSFKLNNIFNKKATKAEQAKPEAKKEIPKKKKDSAAHLSSKKS